jgi:acyl-CoA synthetase (AMP-forming)/AMP-acid ligase II
VLHSHLVLGAGVVLTDLSVVDPCFWNLFADKECTSLAGVPYTFELLDRVGFDAMSLPSLRYVTQAGGRLAPERVRRFAGLGAEQGWDLVVMYGQTEATARMSYLPPESALTHPSSIGRPVPGGAFELEPVPGVEPGTGELVFSGPGVMLGYAERPSDLALGRVVDVLRTGDLARRTPDGFYEVIGRRSRFVKPFGLRIDLDRVETLLREDGVEALCVGDDDALGLVTSPRLVARAHEIACRATGLPAHAVHAVGVSELPRLASGKPDYGTAAALVARPASGAAAATAAPGGADVTALIALFAELLDRPDAGADSTFVSLGGDSLCYVEVSVRLEEALGRLPAGWHVTPIRSLATSAAPPSAGRRVARSIETSVVLRALAIVLVVGTHIGLFAVPGSAHVLVAVAGFNFARFQVTSVERVERMRRQLASLARVVVPSVAWIGGAFLLTDSYRLPNVLLLNSVLGPPTWTVQWHFWFVEVLVYVLVAMTLLLAVPVLDRVERRAPFFFALGLVLVGLLWRFYVVDFGVLNPRPVFWLFAIGWAAARAVSVPERVLVTAAALVSVPGFFDNTPRLLLIAAGLLLLVWAPSVPFPRALTRAVGVLASASLYVYLTHWQVYPLLVDRSPVLALAASLVVGTAYWRASTWAMGRVVHRLVSVRSGKMAV